MLNVLVVLHQISCIIYSTIYTHLPINPSLPRSRQTCLNFQYLFLADKKHIFYLTENKKAGKTSSFSIYFFFSQTNILVKNN